MDNNFPNWVVHNRRKIQEIKNSYKENFPDYIAEGNPLQIGSKNLQTILDENHITTIEKLQDELENGGLFSAPKHRQMVKVFIEKNKEPK